jgi:hypothetical protein
LCKVEFTESDFGGLQFPEDIDGSFCIFPELAKRQQAPAGGGPAAAEL